MINLSPFRVARRVGLVVFAASAMSAHAGSFDSIAGTWWFSLSGADEGALLVHFGAPVAATARTLDAPVTGKPCLGFSREIGSFFVIAADQPVSLGAKGRLEGTLSLTDPISEAEIGELTLVGGAPNRSFTTMTLHATVQRTGGASKRVKLKGWRVESSLPEATGRSLTGKLSGKGIKAGRLSDLVVGADPGLGLPAYTIAGNGQASIGGTEFPALSITGVAMLAPDGRLFGLLDESSDFAVGELSGKLRAAKGRKPPKLRLALHGDRTVEIRATLNAPNTPVLFVTPTVFDFGPLTLAGDSATHSFMVSNIGHGVLSGEATFEGGGSGDFSFVGSSSYGPLQPGDAPVPIEVRFDPSSAGEQTITVRFGPIGGPASSEVSLSGRTFDPDLQLDPNFAGTVTVPRCPATRTLSFTARNAGGVAFDGSATLEGSDKFTLVVDGLPSRTMPLSLLPNESTLIDVKFECAGIWDQAYQGTLNLVGTGGASHSLYVRVRALAQ